MALQTLTPPPPAPQRTDSADEFVAKADNHVAWQPLNVSEMNTLIAQLMVTTALINVAPAYADAGLRAMSGKTPAADRLIYFTSPTASALTTLSAFGRSLIDDADAPAARITLGLGPFSQQGNSAQIGTNGTVGFVMDAAQFSYFATAPIPGSGRVRVGATNSYGVSTFNATNYNAMQFIREVSGTAQEKGTIYVTDTGTSYNTTSDKTHKTDNGLLTASQAWAILRLIEIHNYTWIDTDKDDIGPFAQDLYEVYPNGVTPGGWFDEAGEPANAAVVGAKYRPWSVDHSKLMPLVVTALQDLDARMTALETAA